MKPHPLSYESCQQFQVDGKPETYCCVSCWDEHEGGYHDHRYSTLYDGKWLDGGVTCHNHYAQMEARLIELYTASKPATPERD